MNTALLGIARCFDRHFAASLIRERLLRMASRPGRARALMAAGLLAVAALPAVHAQALLPGQVRGWGSDDYGQLSIAASLNDVSAISSFEDNNLVLKRDGSLFAWGSNIGQTSVIPAGIADIVAIAAGGAHNLVLTRQGTVLAWGRNIEGQINVPDTAVGIIAISAGNSHSLALRSDGKVIAWGSSNLGQTNVPSELTDVVAIAAGNYHSLALKRDGTVRAWGYNVSGIAAPPADLTDVIAIAAGLNHSVALKRDGTVRVWTTGSFGEGNIPEGTENIVAVQAGLLHVVAVTADGRVINWGDNQFGQTDVPATLSGANAISAGNFRSYAANVVPLMQPYEFSGFQAPVDSPPIVNMGKAGRTYPVKFQLKNADGSYISSLDAVRTINAIPAQCGAFAAVPADLLETMSSGATALRYDADANQFIYHWKTPSVGCYTLVLTLSTGQTFPAYFNLNK